MFWSQHIPFNLPFPLRFIKRLAFVLVLSFFCLYFQHTLAEVWVQKTSEMDTSQQYHCRTHLGHLLSIGDLVMGYEPKNLFRMINIVEECSSSRVVQVVGWNSLVRSNTLVTID